MNLTICQTQPKLVEVTGWTLLRGYVCKTGDKDRRDYEDDAHLLVKGIHWRQGRGGLRIFCQCNRALVDRLSIVIINISMSVIIQTTDEKCWHNPTDLWRRPSYRKEWCARRGPVCDSPGSLKTGPTTIWKKCLARPPASPGDVVNISSEVITINKEFWI